MLFYVGEAFALLDEKSCKSVPEKMEIPLSKSRFCEEGRKVRDNSARISGRFLETDTTALLKRLWPVCGPAIRLLLCGPLHWRPFWVSYELRSSE